MNAQLKLPLDATTVNYNWGEIEDMIQHLAVAIEKVGLPKSLMAVSRGGSIITVLLSEWLDVPIIGTIHVNSYVGREQGEILINHAPPMSDHTMETCLIVDDLVDSGNTIYALSKEYPTAKFVVGIGKPKGVEKIGSLLYIQPPIPVANKCWVTFPWETSR